MAHGAMLTGLAICLSNQCSRDLSLWLSMMRNFQSLILSYALQKLQRRSLHPDRLQDRQGGTEGCPSSSCHNCEGAAGARLAEGSRCASGTARRLGSHCRRLWPSRCQQLRLLLAGGAALPCLGLSTSQLLVSIETSTTAQRAASDLEQV